MLKTSRDLETACLFPEGAKEVLIPDGIYSDLSLFVTNSGTKDAPFLIKALNPGKVFFTGNTKVELRGSYITLEGIYFKDGNRLPKEWKTHGPGLVALYGSHNRVTDCLFDCFDMVESAWITTSLGDEGVVPQYCRIDHCSFLEKLTYDQVINLNNTKTKELTGEPAIPMYHQIDHCLFSNPKKTGNAGGGIRVGYWRKDFGRCLIISNLFNRQDSEAEIITSKSRENVYVANTFLNCNGTMNFRHGDRQVALQNFFIGTEPSLLAGGMFVWGSEHVIAGNYFSLPKTIAERGSAAISLNPGWRESEFALAYNMVIANNFFINNNGYDINDIPLLARRIEMNKTFGGPAESPVEITLSGNLFVGAPKTDYTVMFDNRNEVDKKFTYKGNLVANKQVSTNSVTGFEQIDIGLKPNAVGVLMPTNNISATGDFSAYQIVGIPLDLVSLAKQTIQGSPLTSKETGVTWLQEVPGTYFSTGVLSEARAKMLKSFGTDKKNN